MQSNLSLLSNLLERSRLYRTGSDYMKLLNFVSRLRHIAPYNAMLLQIQRQGLRFAASEHDWKVRFNRTIKADARPLIILWPFCPIALVFDVADTEGEELPADIANPFRAQGDVTNQQVANMFEKLNRKGIDCKAVEYGDGHAGHIQSLMMLRSSSLKADKSAYSIRVNARTDPNVQFATLAHELGHLFLGHLGKDASLSIPDRSQRSYAIQELEAEAVSYVVCSRQGVNNISEAYLCNFVNEQTNVDALDIDAILRASGRVETELGLVAKINFMDDKEGAR